MNEGWRDGRPGRMGLYDPAYEKDSCGVGFIAQIKGVKSHDIVRDALAMLTRMDHRGACGCETNTGDGAGILTALPDALLRELAKREAGIELPEAGHYGAGNVFLPRDAAQREQAKQIVARIVQEQGLKLLGWRKLPQNPDGADVGSIARSIEPWMEQVFVGVGVGAEHTSVCVSGVMQEPAQDGPAIYEAFERQLYVVRKRASHAVRTQSGLEQAGWFYICSLSSRVMVYKGQLTSTQLSPYYADLRNERYVSHLAMVHSRFSTNTFPSWDRAQPCRLMSHNGEINTVQGNKNWMYARQGLMESDLFGEDLEKLYPIVEPDCSDSGTFDNVLELLLMSGRPLPEAVMMMIPEAWENHESMPPAKRAFYEYHANLMEPWDGPASVAFTDGHVIGAVLDRNGLRPSRYMVTDDDRVIMASEVGVVEVDPRKVVAKGRLQPGRMFLVDFELGRIVSDEEIKAKVAGAKPYGQWLSAQRVEVGEGTDLVGRASRPSSDNQDAPSPDRDGRDARPTASEPAALLARLKAFGYTTEHLNLLMLPMAQKSQEATGSMGNDGALAVLSDEPRLLYDYFQQLFAQVTNPPIDPIREQIIMSLRSCIGPEGNLLETSEGQAHRLNLPTPVLTDGQLAELGRLNGRGWTNRVVDMTFERMGGAEHTSVCVSGEKPEPAQNGPAISRALDRICREVDAAIADGCPLVILSDRSVAHHHVAIGALLAVGAVHQHLIRNETRTKIALIVESGEPREVHHFCALLGYGADAINPYLAHEALAMLQEHGQIDMVLTVDEIIRRYHKALEKGILKVMSKMGISTIASYKGAQIFEALGLGEQVMERCFTGTSSRLGGAGFDVLEAEALRRHELGYPARKISDFNQLPNPGDYYWRTGGERHAVTPESVAALQEAARGNSREAYAAYVKAVDGEAKERCTLRGLLKIRTFSREAQRSGLPEAERDGRDARPTGITLDEVEPVGEIVKRFRTGAMSFGSLSQEAHETLAVAMNRIGGRSNSGEGGEDAARFEREPNGDWKRSAIKQVASGRFGVTSFYLTNADTLQIKIAQGAKPGEGGQLPGYKVSDEIAKVRHATPGVSLISPPPHHDIYSIEDLAQLIFDLKNANPEAQISVKLVSAVGVGTVAAGVAKAHADHILISGHDGGTGASPLTSIKHAGLPWELGLAETHQTLVLNGLRSRVRLETDGGMRTGRDVVIAACLGAEDVGFGTAPLIAVGCIMMRKCHLNTCPVGICTQDPVLRKKFTGQPEHLVNYLFLVAEEVRQYMAAMGVRTWDEMVGRTDLLEVDNAIDHWKAGGLDLSPILGAEHTSVCVSSKAEHTSVCVGALNRQETDDGVQGEKGRCASPAKQGKQIEQDHGIDHVLDRRLIAEAKNALAGDGQVRIDHTIQNTDRTVGAMLSYEISKLWGGEGLPEDSIELNFTGSAGQSLGAFLAPGVTIRLHGDANDYVGKGLSGGKLIIAPPAEAGFVAEENVLIGNVALYGATSGEAYFRGIAAERFAVRNSGANAVIEGVGDHGCEYMTGGRVVVLGPTGRNFAAGMSGGIAYVHDPDHNFLQNCNLGMVDVEKLEEQEDVQEVRSLIERHAEYTDSAVARRILEDWEAAQEHFAKVMPIDYRRVLQRRKRELEKDMPEVGLG